MTDKKRIFKLKKFSYNMMKATDNVAIVGKRATGKTELVIDILNHFKDIPYSTIIDPTHKVHLKYSENFPNAHIFDQYQNEHIAEALSRQKNVIDAFRSDDGHMDERATLVLDNCMFDDSWQKSSEMREIWYNGRRLKLLTVLTLSYCLGLKICTRNNIDWVFLFKENIQANRKRLYEYFGAMVPDFDGFSKILNEITQDYGCLAIHLWSKSQEIEDCMFWYKVDLTTSLSPEKTTVVMLEEKEGDDPEKKDESHELGVPLNDPAFHDGTRTAARGIWDVLMNLIPFRVFQGKVQHP